MHTRKSTTLVINALLFLFLFLLNFTFTESSRNRTPARILARQTGATQFEEERFETHADCNDHKHHLKKRASDEDVDYEVYQGVVGRPGIDFPIYPRIPKTTFSCRSFGNGYFADMETDCQVFHICEEGRKISFLCPNGTIFQQSELTCDWWFKVNCLGSQGFYAESAEILNKQRVNRVRPSVPVQGFNIVGGATSSGLDIRPKHTNSATRQREDKKTDRRIDSNEEPSLESVDFEDISGEKQLKGQPHKIISNIESNSNDNESQITAESGLTVGSKRRNDILTNSYIKNERPIAEQLERKPQRTQNGRNNGSRRGNSDRGAQRHAYGNAQNESTERPRSSSGSQRGQQRFREDKKTEIESFERQSNEDRKEMKKVVPEKYIDISGRANNHLSLTTAEIEVKPESFEGQSLRTASKTQPTTTTYSIGTYTTARRLESTRTTPFYTPTVPTVVKSKSATEGKGLYIKSVGTNAAATTPSPSRYNAGSISGLVLESSSLPKSTTEPSTISTVSEVERTVATTLRPYVIGMRSNYNAPTPLDAQRVTSPPTKSTTDATELLTTTTQASTTGPTYLPKGASLPLVNTDAAAGDSLLFAPNPASDESVNRNLNEMLRTINLLKDTIVGGNIKDAVEEINFHGQSRTGLEIPPSSGPDALVSLAQYFANEQKGSGTSANLNAVDNKEKPQKFDDTRAAHKVSVASATISTPAASVATANTDDISKSLLSTKTVKQYTNLFNLKEARGKQQTTDPSEGLLNNRNSSGATKTDAGSNSSLFPQIGSTDATIRELAEKPESRKIAQVFSNALATYLEDPKSFRAQLASVRPTEPPIGGKPNFEVVTVTDQTLFNGGSGATYLPTKPTPAFDLTTTKSANIAAEINQKFDYSTPVTTDFSSTTDAYDSTTTLRTTIDSREQKLKLELSAELLPPSPDSGEGEELLQREQSQSLGASRNELESSKKQKKEPSPNAAYVVQTKPTENPWNHISQTDFLDPLTINDGLMKEHRTTTSSPFTYLPKTTAPSKHLESGKHQSLSSGAYSKPASKSLETTRSSQIRQSLESADSSWFDIFNSYDLPRETLPSSSGLQRIANKLFGGLNETEALHLRNVMQQAEHNRQVLSLLLLLIQTCDDQNGKALERSRKHLLNALIDMDGKVTSTDDKSTHYKTDSRVGGTTTSRIRVTTFRRGSDGDDAVGTSTSSYQMTTTTDMPSTTSFSALSTSSPGSIEETTKFEIRVEELDDDFTGGISTTIVPGGTGASGSSNSSDKRALELLKSLYSLASKFTSRR